MARPSSSGSPASPAASPREQVAQALSTLPRYYTVTDLLEAFGGKGPLLDAYVQGWLPPLAEEALEGNATKLLCWLTARLLQTQLPNPGPS